ncbi:type II secretion system protein GspG [Verrucomicrobiota bacterium]
MSKKRDQDVRCGTAGFTLVELMLVIVILGILAGVVMVGFKGQGKTARINATRTSIKNICLAIDMYEVEFGQFPSDLSQLTKATETRGPLIQSASLQDSWGVDFGYGPKGKFQYEIVSAGPDGQMGSADDITN